MSYSVSEFVEDVRRARASEFVEVPSLRSAPPGLKVGDVFEHGGGRFRATHVTCDRVIGDTIDDSSPYGGVAVYFIPESAMPKKPMPKKPMPAGNPTPPRKVATPRAVMPKKPKPG